MSDLNSSVEALRNEFGDKIGKAYVSCGDTVVFVSAEHALDIFRWLRDTPDQAYDYLIDVTAVEHRDLDQPLEVVYFLWSLEHKVQLCVKIALPKSEELAVDSVVPIWRGADWLERETYDMFGIEFRGHPDHRRILMWETYAEGYPLRKDFPLRGHFSRSEQVRQALHANPEAHYSLEVLEIADALGDLPEDMKERIARGERGVVPKAEETDENG
jgi:NADH-quinone oxidoreductase subunit C